MTPPHIARRLIALLARARGGMTFGVAVMFVTVVSLAAVAGSLRRLRFVSAVEALQSE